MPPVPPVPTPLVEEGPDSVDVDVDELELPPPPHAAMAAVNVSTREERREIRARFMSTTWREPKGAPRGHARPIGATCQSRAERRGGREE